MPSYTVKSGDTLSGIGARYGVDWRTITGYRSGNPNLIYPGEVVSWGAPAPAPAPAPAAPAGPSAQDQEVAKWNQRVDSLYGDVGRFDQNAKNPLDIYNAALEKLGIGDARTRVQGLREQLLNTENLLRNVEGDVSARTQEALVSDNQRRRLVAMEEAPIAQQAGILGRNLEFASADYKDIMSEGKAQTEMEYNFQKDQRAALMDRLRLAIDGAKTAEDKRRWQLEYDRLLKKDQEEAARWEKEYALKQQQVALSARSGGGGGGGGGGSQTIDAGAEFINYIKGQMQAAPYSSRQVQDAWANNWFASKGITNTQDRQVYWNLFNQTWNRPENPYDDPFYKR